MSKIRIKSLESMNNSPYTKLSYDIMTWNNGSEEEMVWFVDDVRSPYYNKTINVIRKNNKRITTELGYFVGYPLVEEIF